MTIVVLRALGLGDLITGLPALQLLRRHRADERIVLATPAHWAPIVGLADPSIEVLDAHDLDPLRAAPHRPELAIDLHGNGPASRDVLLELAPRRVIAYANTPGQWRRDEHEVARWCRLLQECLPAPSACPPVGGILGAPPEADVPAGVTVVHCGAKSASRRWPPDRLAEVAALLSADGPVVVTGGPGEEELAEGVATLAGVEARTGLDVVALFALIGRARLVVSGDTGVAHVAAAYEIPSVTLFGPVSPRRWGPPAHPRHQVLWHGDDTGDPHGEQLDPHLARITVGETVAACHEAVRAQSDVVRRQVSDQRLPSGSR